MSAVRKRNYSDKTEYSVVYSDMGGVHFLGDGSGISRSRFAYLENMYRDYDSGGADIIESIPGYRKILDTGTEVHGLFSYQSTDGAEMLAVHSGTKLYLIPTDDLDGITEPITFSGIADRKSDAFFARGALHIIDGENIVRITRDGISLADDDFYIPMLCINYEDYEQRNLLTRSFTEKYIVGSADDICYETEGLNYIILDSDAMTCKLIGYSGTDKVVYVPTRTKIGGNLYTVKQIGVSAFAESDIEECFIAGGVELIGNLAFYKCQSLKKVTLPDSVTEIGNGAFTYCTALNELHFGLGLRTIGNTIVSLCSSLDEITYSGTESDFAEIVNTAAVSERTIIYEVPNTRTVSGIRIINPAVSVEGVSVGGVAVQYDTISHSGIFDTVRLFFDDKLDAEGSEIIIRATLSSSATDYTGSHFGFMASTYSDDGDVASVIKSCTVAAAYDGRIFLTGNKNYPGICFYSAYDIDGENNPLYFGDFNYFRCGSGGADNIAMLPLSDSLAIFKNRQDGDGSIYYHKPSTTNSELVPKIYPVAYTHSGVIAKGAVISFFDDPVFASEGGILALDKSTLNLDRHISVRSHNVNSKLLLEDLSALSLDVWRGYLVAAVGGHIYLADSRATFRHSIGSMEYEWYYLSGIGSYKNDERVFRYSETAHSGFFAKEAADAIAEGEIFSVSSDIDTVYYTEEGGMRYEVYPTEQLRGGEFYPLTRIKVIGQRLFFASSDGSISVFNNDKRGVAPDWLAETPDFDAEEYRLTFGNIIHPSFYSFAGHAPRYALKTARDNCAVPHMLKDTVKNSLSIKCKAIGSGELTVEVDAGDEGYREIIKFPTSSLIFGNVDFSVLTMLTSDTVTIPVSERSRRWVEKQISLYSEAHASPFGICNIAYRFTVKGRIRK